MITSIQGSSTNNDEARLIVTFFAKSRPSNASSQTVSSDSDPFRSQSLACGPTFSSLLSLRVAPASLTLFSSRTLAPGIFQSVYSVTAPFPNPAKFRHHASIAAFEALHALEIVFDLVPLNVSSVEPLRPIRLAVFDMDSTLIDEEVIDELARSIGITSAVASITARAMNGEIEFEQSLRERLALLKGVKADVWEDLKSVVTIAKGAKELIGYLREKGVITVVVSGGFAPMANWLKEQLGLNFAYANHVCKPSPKCSTNLVDIIVHSSSLLHRMNRFHILIYPEIYPLIIPLLYQNISGTFWKHLRINTRFRSPRHSSSATVPMTY